MQGGVGSGLVGDTIGNHKVHGGDDQAVYVYARRPRRVGDSAPAETHQRNLRRESDHSGIDVTEARIGERWRIGTEGLVLEVSAPRTPCRTFEAFLNLNHWIKTFIRRGNPAPTYG